MNVENFLRNALDQKKIKTEQLVTLQTKEAEFIEKEKELDDLLKKAQLDYDNCLRSNLTGDVSNQALSKSKSHFKELNDSIGEIKENLRILTDLKSQLKNELSYLDMDLIGQRGGLFGNLAKQSYEEMASNKKLNEKLVIGYALYRRSNEFPVSWGRYLELCFQAPNEQDLQSADEKLKASSGLLRDLI